MTREQLDTDARVLLGESNVSLHNEFLLALLLKCQLGGRSTKRDVISSPSIPRTPFRRVRPDGPDARPVTSQLCLASQTGCLPDEDGLTMRVLTGAWEEGVDEVSSETLTIIKLALQVKQ